MAWPDDALASVATDVVTIEPGPLRGCVRVPGDKSISHRALLLAALAEGGTSHLRGLADGDDVRRTALALRAMGAAVQGAPPAGPVGVDALVTGGAGVLHEAGAPLDLGNSGTSLRLLAGWVAGRPWFSVLHGDESIARRPMERVVEPLRRMGAQIDGRDGGRLAPLAIRGGDLRGIELDMTVASAQVKSAVLLAGLAASTPTTVKEPAPTRAHTEELLRVCGADIVVSEDGRAVTVGPSALAPLELDVAGDPSQAAFWIVAACVTPGSDVTVEGVYVGRARAGFLDVLRRMGADIEVTMRDAHTADVRARASALVAATVGGAEVPGLIDEIPVLAVAAAAAEGTSEFRDAAELRVKESDRIATVVSGLSALGARVEPRADGVVVHGGRLVGGEVDSYGDHRVAMSAAVAALGATGRTRVRGWSAVSTSYPGFLADLERLRV